MTSSNIIPQEMGGNLYTKTREKINLDFHCKVDLIHIKPQLTLSTGRKE